MIVAVALDLGTTSIKAGLLSADGELSGVVVRHAPPVEGAAGRYESDASAYAEAADAVLAECMAQTDTLPPLGLCSQRSSFLIWERASGHPVTPLISWQDDRGRASCDALREKEERIHALTGLPLTPYYLAPKLQILLGEYPEWRTHLASGVWMLGTLDSFLIWRWTSGKLHVTDVSMAARTLLLDIHGLQWSAELCELFGVDAAILPKILPSAGLKIQLDNGLCLQACVGDQSAALWHGIAPGRREAMVNLGTGGFVAAYCGQEKTLPPGYLQTLVCQDAQQQVHMACEGTLNSIAAALAVYPVESCAPEELAYDDIYCVAEPSGLGAPYFRRDIGLSFSESVDNLDEHRIALLLQEGIIFRIARIIEDFRHELGVDSVYLSGGLSNLPCLQQGIANLVPATYRLSHSEAGLIGAAQLASGVAAGGLRQAQRLEVNGSQVRLRQKFEGWKLWLDCLLESKLFVPGKE
ncbi:MAG: carbohydrate kinase [Gammaproteobacteria bacterium]|nr:carbohydrate kinase [Gammaproteobacteria bacterium]MBU1624363.1 carbohydrate kinase [Gammaproteobacteria bacterium]MBU1981091.1 carbohydrate kinase [Gammaproteobacteria bacterium]